MASKGLRARLARKEDARFLRGRGRFVGDLKPERMQDVAFVRSPLAHAHLHGITIPDDVRDAVFTASDLAGVRPLRAVVGIAGFRPSDQPVLAGHRLRYAGEPVAMCLADTRAEAEDIAQRIALQTEAIAAVSDMLAARSPDAPLLHDGWTENVFLQVGHDGNIAAAAAGAPITLAREFRTARQCMAPLEGRGLVAEFDSRTDQLIVHATSQFPHVLRTGLAECLQIADQRIRVISPDIGGGFGYKAVLAPEEVAVCWLALKTGRAVRWLEDRHEHLSASANCREHHYRITVHADRDGRLLAVDAEAVVDAGAYSATPFTAAVEVSQVVGVLPGPYVIPSYRCTAAAVATNKTPILPYRGVARPGVCYVMEMMIDALARAVGKDPTEVRLLNLIPPAAMPYDNVTGKHFDSGDYPKCLEDAVAAIDLAGVRRRQAEGMPDGRLLGVGFGIFGEQSATGVTSDGKKMQLFEQATARLTPDGRLDLRVGVHSHGQGLETTLAQLANEVLGIDPADVRVVHGDTELSPYSSGTWGSRCIVWAGGAVTESCRRIAGRAAAIGGALLQADAASVEVRDGAVFGPSGSVTLREIARAWYLRPQDLPDDLDPGGLEATEGYSPSRRTGAYTAATHAAVVALDRQTGAVEILDYVVVEDPGVMVNPMIVEGQVHGGTAQGIGTALYEEMPFSATGIPLAPTFADYVLPGPTEVPDIRVHHMETPSPYTVFGIKGVGEGGAIGPLAAIGNAVNDALRPLGVEITELPITPARVLRAIAAAPGPDAKRIPMRSP